MLHLARPPSEPEPPLSKARERLAGNFREIAEQRRRLDELGAPGRRLEAARARLEAAQAVVDAIAEAEAAALKAWTAKPTGSLPSPRTAERTSAIVELTEAQVEHDEAQKTWATIEPEWRRQETAIHDIVRQQPQLIDAIVVEEIERLGTAFIEASNNYCALLGSLRGARDQLLRDKRGGGLVQGVEAWMRKGSVAKDATLEAKQRLDTIAARGYASAAALPRKLLLGDVEARVEIDDGDPNAISSEAAA